MSTNRRVGLLENGSVSVHALMTWMDELGSCLGEYLVKAV